MIRAGYRSLVQVISTAGLYGAERVLIEIARHAASRGWTSHICLLESSGARALVQALEGTGATAEIVPGSRNPLVMATQLRSVLRARSAGVVQSHGYRGDVLLALARLPANIAKITTCHSWYRENWRMRMYEWLDKRSLRKFDHIVAVSPGIEKEILSAGVRPDRVSVLENGVDVTHHTVGDRNQVRRGLGLDDGRALVVRIGRLARAKGNDLLLQAFAQLPADSTANLLFVGDGEEREVLERLAGKLGIHDRVMFTGFRSDAHGLLAAADLMVIPSLQEGLPMVLLEAMASGTAVVSTAVGAIPGVIRDGVNGRMVPAGEPDALSLAMRELLADPALRARLANQARRDHAAQYSGSAMADRYLKVYQHVMESKGFDIA